MFDAKTPKRSLNATLFIISNLRRVRGRFPGAARPTSPEKDTSLPELCKLEDCIMDRHPAIVIPQSTQNHKDASSSSQFALSILRQDDRWDGARSAPYLRVLPILPLEVLLHARAIG
jgi:hypothetical protein